MGVYKLYYSTVNKYFFENDLKVGYGYYIEFMVSKILFDYGHCAKESRCDALAKELVLDYDVQVTEDPLDSYVNGFDVLVMVDPTESPVLAEEYMALHSYLKGGGRFLLNYIPRNRAKHERFLEMTSNSYPLVERVFGRPIQYADREIPSENINLNVFDGRRIASIESGFLGRKKEVDVFKIPIPLTAIRKDPKIHFYYPVREMYGDSYKPVIEMDGSMKLATMDVDEEDSIRKSGLAWFKGITREDEDRARSMTEWGIQLQRQIVMHREFITDDLDWVYIAGFLRSTAGVEIGGKGGDEVMGDIVWALRRRAGIIGKFSDCVGYAVGICANPFADEYTTRSNSANLRFAKYLFAEMTKGSTMSSRPITDVRVVRERQKKQQPDRIDFPFTMP
jgi:hypothetical protein